MTKKDLNKRLIELRMQNEGKIRVFIHGEEYYFTIDEFKKQWEFYNKEPVPDYVKTSKDVAQFTQRNRYGL